MYPKSILRLMGGCLFVGMTAFCLPANALASENTPPIQSVSIDQAKVVRGHVVDENGEPLIGVTVKVAGSNNGAITDLNGNFSLLILPASKAFRYPTLAIRVRP